VVRGGGCGLAINRSVTDEVFHPVQVIDDSVSLQLIVADGKRQLPGNVESRTTVVGGRGD